MEEILKMERLLEVTGLGRSTIYRLEQQDQFPKRVMLTPRSSGWLRSEVEAWLQARVDEREVGNETC